MSIEHNGYTFACDGYCQTPAAKFISTSRSERGAIAQARGEGWFIGNIRITAGIPRSKIRTMRRVLGPCCKWLVGA